MSDEQVKGIQRWTSADGDDGAEMWADANGEYVLFTDHEQALAALEAENATLKSFQCNFEHATSLERAENEQQLAALEARNRELEKIVHAVQNSHPNCDKNYYVGNDTRIDNRCSLCAAIDAALKGAS